ncbi:MAG TPA: beta-propeller fold lactonase family protein [Candidatus Acidoferrum sp.]|nr:beta-propeller fold lactonase family protein [Candidatus Acidoferrum sp.]
MRNSNSFACGIRRLAAVACATLPLCSLAAEPYQIWVSNERSGDVTIINSDLSVVGTIPVGKRPRGIHASADGKNVYVALSGTPIGEAPQLDAAGNPILKKGKKDDDDDDDAGSDKSADGIGVIDVAQRKTVKKISVGSDPEEFALSHDGAMIYVSNEDVKTMSAVNIASGKVEHIVRVSQEPEGVAVTPDGNQIYVTCEAGGDIFIIDAHSYKTLASFKVPVRPRSVDFLSNAPVAFIPSESVGLLNVVDTEHFKVLRAITLPTGSRPMRVRVATDNSKVYVSDGRAGTITVIDARNDAILGSVAVGKRPWGVVLSPDGKYLFTANGPSNDVSVVDTATAKEVTRIKAGNSPWGLTIVPMH